MNANMIYLEAPVGVGFSKGSADDMKHISDDTTSSDNRDALKVNISTNLISSCPNLGSDTT